MTHLDAELDQLRQAIHEMMVLAHSQLEKSKRAFLSFDKDLAQEIIHYEKRMNSMELSIDRDCENLFALFQPVASDLRFVISMMKINSGLERIGDYADGIADYVVDLKKSIDPEAIKVVNLGEMFDITLSMLTDIDVAIDNKDTSLARIVYKKDAELNEINANASNIIRDIMVKDTDQIRPLMFLFSTVRKLERVGDHIKNMAEELIFYTEAEVLKHKGKLSTSKQKG